MALQGSVIQAIRNKFFTVRVATHWNRLPRDVLKSPSLEVLKRHLDLVLGEVV